MLILAPMQGLTEVLFRKTYQKCFPGAFDYAISPFLSLTHGNLVYADKKLRDVLPETNINSIPVIPQILGNEPQEFIALVNRLADLGYEEVNWNLGCPVRRVAAKKRGSGMLPFPNLLRTILDNVIPSIQVPLSVKVRLGYNSADEIYKVIPVLNDYPLKNVTIHPRIGRQMYGGHADMEAFCNVAPLVKHTVIYNGDVFSVSDYTKIRSRFPYVNDVMIGRGALFNPLLPSLIKGNGKYKMEDGKKFIRCLMEEIDRELPSEEAKIRKSKEYWGLLSHSLPYSEQEKRRVLQAPDLDMVHRLILEMTQ